MSADPTTPESVPSPPAPEPVELVRKVFVRDLRVQDRLTTVFRVLRKQRQVSRAGKVYVAVGLGDRTGEVEARIFENVDGLEGTFGDGDYVLVAGPVITFHGKPQLVIEKLERLDPGPIDAREFDPPAAPPAPASRAEASSTPVEGGPVNQIRELVDRIQDRHVRQLLIAFLDDPTTARRLPEAPAAKGVHHAYKGGLAEHLLSVMKLAHRIADHYPMADRDLLVAGALLHDIGKVTELTWERGGFEYSDEGRLVGHLVMTAQLIRQFASRIDGFPPLLEQHLTHLVLAHHGEVEFGSPKVPMTIEALLVHLMDLMDSRVASWLEIMAKDPNERWTEVSRMYERHLWKAPAPTSHGRAPVESRRSPPGNSRNRKRSRQVAAPAVTRLPMTGPSNPKREEPAQKREATGPRREDVGPKPERDPDLPEGLSFKPFSLLTGSEDAPPEPPASE